MTAPLLVPVILCGGSGTRLWPLSRETYPKQFLTLQGTHSLLQNTLLRMRDALPGVGVPGAPLLVCNTEHRFVAAEQLQSVGANGAHILLEPVGRNTAPALTIAALLSADADPVLLATPADHVITDVPAFHAAVQRAYPLAASGAMVAFGIVPDRAETGYGYIRCAGGPANAQAPQPSPRLIEHFAEKPDAATAAAYVESGQYLWNSGLFMIRASQWLAAIEQCRPDILQACSRAMADAVHDLDFIRPDAKAFEACPSDSIDYAVMERLPAQPELGIAAYAVALDAGWTDLGAWDALWTQLPQDADGNAALGDTLLHACKDSLLLSTSRLVAAVGLSHLVVVETPDAVLVADQSRIQDVKHIVTRLKTTGKPQAQQHRKVHRPWGWYDAIDSGDRFLVKRLMVKPGASLSLQMHRHRAEHWVVVRGVAQVTCGEKSFALHQNESTYIPVGQRHRLANPGKTPLEIIEVQSGDHLSEDDILRFEDSYGRAVPGEAR